MPGAGDWLPDGLAAEKNQSGSGVYSLLFITFD
jgi:hypothetical protein